MATRTMADLLEERYAQLAYERDTIIACMAHRSNGRPPLTNKDYGDEHAIANAQEVRASERWTLDRKRDAFPKADWSCYSITADGKRQPFNPPEVERESSRAQSTTRHDAAGDYEARLALVGAADYGE